MLFPKEKIRILESYENRPSIHGWIEMDIKSVDVEGAGKLLINLDDLENLKQTRQTQADALSAAKKLLGG